MVNYALPTTAEIGGKEYEIRSDYRAALDIIGIMGDPELTDGERAELVLTIFYPDALSIPSEDLQEAVEFVYWFIGGGEDNKEKQRKPRLIDWEQDFQLIVAPINRVAGCEVRALDYLHWWSFLSYFYEIGGDCMFAQVVDIRSKKAKHKQLDKADREFYRQNKKLIDIKTKTTAEEDALFDELIGGGKQNE